MGPADRSGHFNNLVKYYSTSEKMPQRGIKIKYPGTPFRRNRRLLFTNLPETFI
jgi:hypothetical protein